MLIDFFICLVSFVIILSIVVFIHEFGHYIVAIKNGVQVDEFAIGYGKEIYGWNDKRGTRWKVCLLPFGGFVKFFADEDESSSFASKEKLMKLSEEDKKKCLYFKSVWQRIQVVSAGPVFNYLLAIAFFTIFFAFSGVNYISNRVEEIESGSVASKNDIFVGDRIISINGKKTESLEDIKTALTLSVENEISLTIDRNGEIIEKVVVFDRDQHKNGLFLGIASSELISKKVNVFGAFRESLKHTWFLTTTTLKALGQMISGRRGFEDVGGPIKIARFSGVAMKGGVLAMIYFIALISASLGLMNILPIPVLDGGHLLFYVLEAIRKKPLDEKVENYLTKFFYYLLIFLMIFVTCKDIKGIF